MSTSPTRPGQSSPWPPSSLPSPAQPEAAPLPAQRQAQGALPRPMPPATPSARAAPHLPGVEVSEFDSDTLFDRFFGPQAPAGSGRR